MPILIYTWYLNVAIYIHHATPRHRKFFVATTVALTALAMGCFLYFLFPRTVIMQCKGRMQTLHTYLPPKDCLEKNKHVNITFMVCSQR